MPNCRVGLFVLLARGPGVHEEAALSRQFLLQVDPVCMRNRFYLGSFSCSPPRRAPRPQITEIQPRNRTAVQRIHPIRKMTAAFFSAWIAAYSRMIALGQ